MKLGNLQNLFILFFILVVLGFLYRRFEDKRMREENKDNYEAVALAGFLTGHLVSMAKESDTRDCRDMRIRTRSHIGLNRMKIIDLNVQKNVWCPETIFGTWVMKQGDTIFLKDVLGKDAKGNESEMSWNLTY